MTACICGCGERAVHKHHVVTRAQLRAASRTRGMDGWQKRLQGYVSDPRNLVPMTFRDHMDHHARSRPLALSVLPDAVFDFAAEILGPPLAYETLARAYSGTDKRLDALKESSRV